MNLKPNCSNPWNLQLNAILERIHQVLGDRMRTFDLENAGIGDNDKGPFDEYLSSRSYTMQSTYHQTHRYSTTHMVFGQDMFLDTKINVNWDEINQRKQERIHKNYERENGKHIDQNYSP